ncbi:MAG: hypothetical protein B6243_00730 [Anaerolineaceae bacterium 4572_5.2]|nr:MAG: hypothetical protein B6243_00730 [Anaerolineaceae bacterium 4572_5.2]
MTYKTITTDEIEVLVSGFFTTRHQLRANTEVIGELTLRGMKMLADFRSPDGRELEIEKTNWWKSIYEMREGGAVKGIAYPRGLFNREFLLDMGERIYVLTPIGFGGRVWRLLDNVGTLLLEVRHRGAFRRGANLTIRGEIDFPLMLFAYYLVNARWQEQHAAAAA